MVGHGVVELLFVDLTVTVGVSLIEVLLEVIFDFLWDFTKVVSSSILVSTIVKFLEDDVTIIID
jgi:hypothetical protein